MRPTWAVVGRELDWGCNEWARGAAGLAREGDAVRGLDGLGSGVLALGYKGVDALGGGTGGGEEGGIDVEALSVPGWGDGEEGVALAAQGGVEDGAALLQGFVVEEDMEAVGAAMKVGGGMGVPREDEAAFGLEDVDVGGGGEGTFGELDLVEEDSGIGTAA